MRQRSSSRPRYHSVTLRRFHDKAREYWPALEVLIGMRRQGLARQKRRGGQRQQSDKTFQRLVYVCEGRLILVSSMSPTPTLKHLLSTQMHRKVSVPKVCLSKSFDSGRVVLRAQYGRLAPRSREVEDDVSRSLFQASTWLTWSPGAWPLAPQHL